ncbi:hypothetical protein VMCG_03686 [Cytospora schulzeri]|uniref:Uncharacterized protein n=1 Tax=Cytospora schulzeri TaxID=448051 RepID=A0A423WUS5_9PEZI|nr:hypothetical protein VMCG_03686 [Valsa malicola]
MSTSPNLPRSASHKYKHIHLFLFLFVELIHYLVFLVEFVFIIVFFFLITTHNNLFSVAPPAETTALIDARVDVNPRNSCADNRANNVANNRANNHLSIASYGGHPISKRACFVVEYGSFFRGIYSDRPQFGDDVGQYPGALFYWNNGTWSDCCTGLWEWREYTLLTPLSPLSVEPSFGKGEKGAYMIQRDSIGPTPLLAKVKASVMAQYNRVRGTRDTSTSHKRDGSHMTMKDRIMEVWASFRGSQNHGPIWNENKNDTFSARGIGGSMKEKGSPRSMPFTHKSDLLMGSSELDSEAQRRRLSRTRGASVGTAFGGLDLNFGGDPFDDINATSHPSANPPPLFATGANNPFSDANAMGEVYMPKQPTYVTDMRHSRGQSVDSTFAPNRITSLRVVDGMSRPPSGSTAAYADSSVYFRDSASSFDTRRNKFRSDPFDLEPLSRSPNVYGGIVTGSNGVPTVRTSGIRRVLSTNSERYRQGMGTTGGSLPAQGGDMNRIPVPSAHVRYNSLGSSRYTSGVSDGSMGVWPAPGPDLGRRGL